MPVTYLISSTAGTDTAGTTLVINKPSGTADGNLLVAFVGHSNNSGYGTPPAGWTLGVRNFRAECYWKVASGEGADYTWTFPSGKSIATIARLSGARSSGPIGFSAISTTISSSSTLVPAATPPEPNTLLLVYATTLAASADAFITAPHVESTTGTPCTAAANYSTGFMAQDLNWRALSSAAATNNFSTACEADVSSTIGISIILLPATPKFGLFFGSTF